jgi:hypothetical protein
VHVGVGVDVRPLEHAVLLGGEGGRADLAVAVGVVLGVAEEDGQVPFGIGCGGGLAAEVFGEELDSLLLGPEPWGDAAKPVKPEDDRSLSRRRASMKSPRQET